MRIGFGFDAHRLVPGRPLMLAGVRVPYERGLEGFSDGDVVAHAIIDALLGAAGLGDCGSRFPAGDPKYAGADSLKLLHESVALLAHERFRVENLDCTIVADQPALASHLDAMRAILANALKVAESECSIKAKRTEGLGFTGRGDGIAAYAVALVEKS